MHRHFVTLDSIALRIAAEAGVAWRELPDHPGYWKGRWRDSARCLIRQATPAAVFIDGQRQWNGKMSEDLVANLRDEDVRRAIESGRRRMAG
jgi:hypothetical protein